MSSFYQKYRPQTFVELDNNKARDFLTNLIRTGKVAHAYLFTGPKGIGKTTCARLLAKALNCTASKAQVGKPCNLCEVCQAISVGVLTDVMEIDAASNRGIDEMRTLRERIALSPTQARRKVYIIDEVHMLTTEAFNALLKTLEEPPPHALFVLCTTEPHKVPATIVSRCQHLVFERATAAELVNSLKRVIAREELTVPEEVITEIAQVSEGSFRDAIKYLDQLLSQSKNPKVSDLDAIRHTASSKDRAAFLKAILALDGSLALQVLSSWEKVGMDFLTVAYDLLYDLRVCFLVKQGVVLVKDEARVEALFPMIKQTSLNQITELLRAFIASYENIRTLPIPIVVFELLVGEWMVKHMPDQVILEKVKPTKLVEPAVEKKLQALTTLQTSETAVSQADQSDQDVEVQSKVVEAKTELSAVGLDVIISKWGEFVKEVKKHNQTLGTIVRQAKPLVAAGGVITVEVLYTFHRDRLEQTRVRKKLSEIAAEVFGNPFVLTCELGSRPMKGKDLANVDMPIEEAEVFKAVADIFGAEAAG